MRSPLFHSKVKKGKLDVISLKLTELINSDKVARSKDAKCIGRLILLFGLAIHDIEKGYHQEVISFPS